MIRRIARIAALALALAPGGVAALDLSLPPGAVMAREQRDDAGRFALPVGPWADGAAQTREVAGALMRQAWRIGGASSTTLQLMDRLEAQLRAAGYETLFRCEDEACGGFDFRFALNVLPPPEMFVDLFDYRYLSAMRGQGDNAEYITLLVSRSGAANYLQVTQIAPETSAAGAQITTPEATTAPVPDRARALISALRTNGHAVLTDLEFDTGAAALGPGPFASLASLAAYLKADSSRRIALVGHTDTVGGYDVNLDVSRRRARAVMDRLATAHDVPTSQMEAQGIAYLAPRGPNSTAGGREANRRVETVLLSGD